MKNYEKNKTFFHRFVHNTYFPDFSVAELRGLRNTCWYSKHVASVHEDLRILPEDLLYNLPID
jgi:hypothetical protein